MNKWAAVLTAIGAPVPYAIAAWGTVTILRAGSLERRGDLVTARRFARRGGFLVAGGTLAAVVLLGAAILLPPGRDALSESGRSPFALPLALLAALAAGAVGLLGGLSGKPRPSGGIAAALLAASAGAALAL